MSRVSYPNLVGELAVVKGETYRKLIESNAISFDGNLTAATLRGQIRDNYVDAGGALLATFSFENSVYDAELDKTFLKPYLTEFATLNLTSTNKYREGVEPNVKTTLVYDIELFFNDEIIKYAPGFVQVIGEVTGGTVSYNPAEEWTAGINSIELLSTVGFTKTYIIWGDAEKTINLGTFDVIDTQPTEGVSGFSIFAVEQDGDWDVAINNTVTVTSSTLATSDKQDDLIAKLPDGLTVIDSELLVNATLGDIIDIDGNITVENLPDITGLATNSKQDDLLAKIPGGLTVTGDRLKVDANVSLPDAYTVDGSVDVNNYATLVTALEAATLQAEIVNNVSVIGDLTVDTTGLASDSGQATTNTTLSTINGKIPSNLTVSATRLLVDGSGVTQPISGSITNISGTVSLPTGAATATNQTTANNSLSSIDNKLPSLESGRVSVVLPASQVATLTPPTTITANLGTIADVATETTLSTLNTKIPANLTVSSTRLLVDSGLTQPLTNTELRAVDVPTIVNSDQSILLSELLYYAQSHNLLNGKFCQAFTILGNRTSFANTTAYHDLCEFLTTDVVFTPVTTAISLEVVSTSVNDTSAGTGTRSIKVTYLNNAGLLSESSPITLNGTTPVSVGFTASAILWMEAWEGGSDTVSAGNITLRNSAAPTTIYEQITAGGNKSLSGRFTVPSNCCAYLVDYDFAAITQTMDIRLRATVDTYTRQLNNGRYLFQVRKYLASGQNIAQDGRFLKFGAGASIKVSAIPGATTGNPRCDSNFTLLVVEN